MLTANRIMEIEEELLKLQLELQQYVFVDPSVQPVTNHYQSTALACLQKARSELNAVVHNMQQYPKVS